MRLESYGLAVLAAGLLAAPPLTFADPPSSSRDGTQACASGPTLGIPPEAIGDHHVPAPLAKLGHDLFFDTRLSADGTVSCATCHQPEHGFTDGRPLAVGLAQRKGTRNTPSVINAALQGAQFWDGRRNSIEAQVFDPLLNANEHGLAQPAEVIDRVREDRAYVARFEIAFGVAEPEREHIAEALASYVRSLATGDSPFDRYAYGCDARALSASAARGLALFTGRAQCSACHTIGERSASFTDNDYHSVGVGLDAVSPRLAPIARRVAATPSEQLSTLIGSDPDVAALGRFVVTLDPRDIGKFRTPSLRNVAETAPYMHDGSVPTLEAAVDRELYYRGQAIGRPLVLTPVERQDLVFFLRALTSAHLGEIATR